MAAPTSRLSIPSVNQDPRPPQGGPAHHGGPTATKTKATSTAQPTNAAAGQTSAPNDPFKSAATTTASAPPSFALPAYTPQQGQADPRDATYWANVAKLKFSDEQEYGQGLREQQRSDTDFTDALQTAIRNRGKQQRELGENAIRGNLGASGWLNRNEAEQTGAYTQERAHASRNKEEEDQDRAARQKAIVQGFGIDAGGLLTEAGSRYAEAQERAAENEAPYIPPSEGSTSAGGGSGSGAGSKKPSSKPKKKSGGGTGSGGTSAPKHPAKTAIGAAANASKPKKKKG